MAAGWAGIADLMAEVGDTLGVAETVEMPDTGEWHIRSGADAVLVAAYDPESDRLLFRSGLGRPDAALREATYELLLAYNGSAGETGGAWIGLDAPGGGGEAVLRYAAPAATLDGDVLRGLILDLLRVGGGLREYVGREAPAAAETGRQPLDLDTLRFHAIRG